MATQQQNIGEVLQFFNEARRPVKSSDRVPGPFPYLGASGTVDYVEEFTHEGSYLCVSEDGANLLTRSLPIAWVQDGKFWANNHLQVLGGVSREHLTFFRYAIESTNIAAYVTGSAQPKLSKASLSSVKVPKFSRGEEERIGKLLSAIDDKIAANQLAIHKIQELLHAQWHTITNTGVSSTEPISSIADVNPRTSKPQSDECSFLEMKDLPEYGLIVDRWGKRETKGGTKFRNGDVLLARITPCFENGKMAIVDFLEDDEVGMGSTEYIVFRPKEDIPAAAIHAIISSPEFRSFGYKALTGTSGRQRIAADDLKEIAVPWPPESALTEYRQLADVLLKKATALRNENQVLARTRDELLPLLMSGRITVGEAEEAADVAGTAASES
ncbi:restriction endonuclease subunit S [Corynebacterium hadale]|uniref:restriction endonuclease subunit S n=1 Tax=Corynebacterium hadale TaxID=2026255 RepID=UPI000BAA4EB9|nr:restriction endonuclease subunit S [Corynebacterium hadale]PAT07752.1 hypothetical protein CKJ82_08855 [Corynebacterium hadale]